MKKETTVQVGRCTRMGLIEEEGCLTGDYKNLPKPPSPYFPFSLDTVEPC